jgi:hypothetical protein
MEYAEFYLLCSIIPKGWIRQMNLKRALIFFVLLFLPNVVVAGPPFKTDDPEPVEFKHWEIYLASQYSNDRDGKSMTLPHVEINYGLVPNMQIQLITPFEYVKQPGQGSQYGYGDTELEIKYRFVQETKNIPQVGTSPLVEIPTGDESRGLGTGHVQYFLPLWVQKSWGPWTTYVGGGYWNNPGEGNKNWWFFGWLLQRNLNKMITLGAEIYYKSASTSDLGESKGYTVGTIINFTEHHHLLLSAGQDIYGPNYFNSYIAYQLTF